MSSPPQETETRTVELSHEERWVVHHALVSRADEHVDNDDQPPAWILNLFETIEADEETMTVRQGRKLHDLLQSSLGDDRLPSADADHASAVVDQLEAVLS